MPASPKESSFADLMEQLEQLVTSLQGDDMPLEEAIEAYERGSSLLKQAQERLQSAEQRVQTLMEGEAQETRDSGED
jgi:exodeoxyribonuclease VII small subunit